MKNQVEKALRDNPRLRDSDLALLGYIWQLEGFVMTPEQKQKFMTLTTAETITRQRRRLRDKYPGSDKVEKERFRRMEEYVDEFGNRTMRFYD